VTERARPSVLRDGAQFDAVTSVELFFDLVYVFAVTQLSHLLVTHPSWSVVAHAGVLLAMVWQVWIYTTWCTNYADPRRPAVRGMLLALVVASLVLAAGLGGAFGRRGTLVAGMYAGIQLGRTAYMLWLLRGERLLPVFVRIVPWTTATSVLVLIGSQQSDHVRAAVWAAAVAVDLAAAAVGFPVPHWGRSTTLDWTIAGGHFAERCQAFVLIALGESLVVIGTRLSDEHLSAATVAAFLAAVVGSIALWWVYFDRAADDSSDVIARSSDPGRLARNAFHWIHPVIVGGIIAAAAADDLLLRQPRGHPASSTVWLLLGGPALFLLGHAMFKAVVWRTVSAPRVVAATVLVALVPAGTHLPVIALAWLVAAIVVGVAVADRILHPPSS
jgi:low temperature requirement protein LtrA